MTANATILCVEDEPRLRANIVEELNEAGYTTLEAGDGRSALTLIQSQRPDLILCDITMPRMGGYELLHAVRDSKQALSDVPFVFLTALSDRGAVIEGKSAGADDYLTKPIDFDLMLATIKSRLDQVRRIRTTLDAKAAEHQTRVAGEAIQRGLSDLARAFERVSFGVLLFNGKGELLHKNPRAALLLGAVLTVNGSRIGTHSTSKSAALRQALSAAIDSQASSDFIAIERDEGHPLLVQFEPLGTPEDAAAPRAAAFLVDTNEQPPVSQAVAAKLFGFTPSEARVAAALARGQAREEIISDLGISSTTFAFHLRNIFRKAQVGRQQDLVALLTRSAVIAEIGEVTSGLA